mmetsp:Transcript_17658/g.46941  ORF Transcript_17658/g.46941 Transcript_17658/m.46941 type:complete len:234 (-) Transcript_17658:42-743(-)
MPSTRWCTTASSRRAPPSASTEPSASAATEPSAPRRRVSRAVQLHGLSQVDLRVAKRRHLPRDSGLARPPGRRRRLVRRERFRRRRFWRQLRHRVRRRRRRRGPQARRRHARGPRRRDRRRPTRRVPHGNRRRVLRRGRRPRLRCRPPVLRARHRHHLPRAAPRVALPQPEQVPAPEGPRVHHRAHAHGGQSGTLRRRGRLDRPHARRAARRPVRAHSARDRRRPRGIDGAAT